MSFQVKYYLMLIFPLRSAFLALPLEGEAKEEFRRIQESLEPFADILRFQNPATPHLTLQFWRELMQIEYDQVREKAVEIASKATPFTLRIEGVETFGSKGRDSVLFLSVPFSEPLARLRKLCPWPSEHPFHAHITIARIAHPERFARVKKRVMKILSGVSFEMEVSLLRLYAEVDGQQQTPLHDFPFAKS